MDVIIPESVKAAAPIVTCTIEGILEEEDLRALVLGTPLPSMPEAAVAPATPEPELVDGDLKKIREKHHSLARMIADGMTQRMAGRIAGFSESYVSILLNSPSMQELIELYRIQNGAAHRVIAEKLRSVGMKAVEALDKALDANELKDPHALAAVAKLGLDRSDHGPSSRVHRVDEHHIVDHAKLREQMAEAQKGSRNYIVPVTEVRKALEPPVSEPEEPANG